MFYYHTMMIEVADIFREFSSDYKKLNKLPKRMHKAMNAIERCRTSQLGGHIEECDSCGHIRIAYNSCRNRHCPKCQGAAKEKWLVARKKDLLPVGYFHIVFTIPADLNSLALRNQREIYNIIFKAASETLLELGKDSKYLGGEIGLIAILHTWGQNLMDHPHLHCIVPAGGLSMDKQRWIPSRKRFFIPVKVISRLYRGKFLAYLKKAYNDNKLEFEGQICNLGKRQEFQSLIDKQYQKEWVVYCKPPFQSPEHILEYLGRYTHRVAITNQRIVEIKNRKVSFRWKDYADNNQHKVMTIDGLEFIRRFLLHILPDKFVKLRHYGLLSNRNHRTKLTQCKKILGVWEEQEAVNSVEKDLPYTKIDIRECPCCKNGRMIKKEILTPQSYIPPNNRIVVA